MTKRQNIRKALITISFFLFPITIYYFSPVLPIMGALQGIFTGSMLVFSLLTFIALILGRTFCGWLCPAGGLQEICTQISNNPVKKGRWIKYIIWIVWFSFIIFLFLKSRELKEINFFYMTTNGLSIAEPRDFIIYYSFTSLILILAVLIGRRSFCHHICWMAPFMVISTKISNLIRLPKLELLTEKEKCIDCKICTKKCAMSIDVNKIIKQGKINHIR